MTTEKPSRTGSKPEGKGDIFDSALKFGVGVQVFLFVLTFLVLDGGVLNRQYAVVMVGYWVAVAAMMVRRRAAPTRSDVAFLRYGNFGLLVAAPLIARMVYWVIGLIRHLEWTRRIRGDPVPLALQPAPSVCRSAHRTMLAGQCPWCGTDIFRK